LAYLYASAKNKRVEQPQHLDQRKKDNAAVLLPLPFSIQSGSEGKKECVVPKKHLSWGKPRFSKFG
jgi:hypothetical protein